MLRLCVICKKNETSRLMDGGWGEKLPVCGECLRTGRWRELLPSEPEGEVTESAATGPVVTEPKTEGLHKHRYTKKSDVCKVPGCGHVRVPRKKK